MKDNLKLAALFAFTTALLAGGLAVAQDDAFATPLQATSTSGASAVMSVPGGTRVVLQSLNGAFHYRACSSSCTALQTDLYVPQYAVFDVPLLASSKFIAVVADGTTSATVTVYQNNIP